MADAALTRVALGVVAVEAVALLGAGIVLIIGYGDSYGVGTGVFALLLGALVAWLGRSLGQGALWARTPVVFIQIMALPVGIGFLQAGDVGVGVAALVVAFATGLSVLAS